jgi:hypothetical protein
VAGSAVSRAYVTPADLAAISAQHATGSTPIRFDLRVDQS